MRTSVSLLQKQDLSKNDLWPVHCNKLMIEQGDTSALKIFL